MPLRLELGPSTKVYAFAVSYEHALLDDGCTRTLEYKVVLHGQSKREDWRPFILLMFIRRMEACVAPTKYTVVKGEGLQLRVFWGDFAACCACSVAFTRQILIKNGYIRPRG